MEMISGDGFRAVLIIAAAAFTVLHKRDFSHLVTIVNFATLIVLAQLGA